MPSIFHKYFAIGRPVAKILIKYNSNNLEEKDDVEKEPIDIELTEQKADPEMMKMLLTINDQVFKKKTEKILLWLTSLKKQNKLKRIFFPKKYLLAKLNKQAARSAIAAREMFYFFIF